MARIEVLVGLSFLVCFNKGVSAEKEYQICINKSAPILTDEQKLYMSLMAGYDRHTRPVYNASHSVDVYIGITLTQVFDVDEKNQVLTTNIWLDQEWKDEKLYWDPGDYNGLKVLRIPCSEIWKPDIVLYNSAEDYTNGYMQALAMVQADGTVFWPPIVKLRSTCQIDITYFPFDDQVCKMKIGSWAYDGFQVNVYNRSATAVDLSNYVENGEWDLVSVEAIRNVVYYQCCPEPFPDVTFTIHLRRRTLYYTYNVITPCIMLSTLTLLVFWMSPESGEKVTLGLTVLLAFSVFMLLIAENMPATSSFVPLIGIYLTSVMSLTSFSVILAVTVSNISSHGRKEISVPRWLKKLVIILARIMCKRLYFIRPVLANEGEVLRSGMRGGRQFYKGTENNFSNDSGCGLIDYENGEPTSHRRLDNVNTRREFRNVGDFDEVLARLQELIFREEEKEKEDNMCREWQEAAEVIDRFMFWIFITGTVSVTLVLLIVLPMTKADKTT
ncbi:neuronal acetylcholine receptor subunit alpha-10-like isoform X2 [Haliotis rufescens]|nr:neuronal acetylcholine receptor subunit alpha-10-like isoform X2 [Haliotis rufescens]XP_046373224.1 neuronal acetylcholine receptor subunit alpha-10-like isoform X2 [Haliotis rufescens]XP_046373225.1 neuronal acetylcholine receptor subunit alpha-10-like isoform X2 [Haliotis rufescens]XP_046373227.1 neuronal acetylcholine receptor subunit alpha-10-like isoform X2 [Haliotis rufescens]XP_046373228.1 neuronal acetylcholine receptor subunit alpha-10-like isoform X2 [Haliotis rufescens]XP_0463732